MSNGSRSRRKGTKYNFGASPTRGRGGSKKKKAKAKSSKGGTFVPTEQAKAVARSKARKSARSKAVGNPSAAPINRGAGSKSEGAFIGPNPSQKGRTKARPARGPKVMSQYQQRTGKSEGVFRTGDKRKAETRSMMESLYHPNTQQPRIKGKKSNVRRHKGRA